MSRWQRTADGPLLGTPASGADRLVTPWGDRNARVRAPDGMHLTLFSQD
jgi:hypothetical protein